ncbi:MULTISPECIES: hypothetical protein [Lactococcus]|uniref:Uncharacterized protein n=2 Tax=Lactococcus TaxID=1357 RepID=A0A387BJX9_9LACT|nr:MULTISPECIES: hypothetical protein [Lactococcus]AYG01326.1 hypothetical protein D7I46_09600 [Lactococcus allomyrinae]QDK70176.1 hypothetical protein FLP15_02005 [Lactococcus protaetiae]QDK70738.1 hypothetical protein FLP15_05695 [Lactococcus protaetiae]
MPKIKTQVEALNLILDISCGKSIPLRVDIALSEEELEKKIPDLDDFERSIQEAIKKQYLLERLAKEREDCHRLVEEAFERGKEKILAGE